MHFPSGLKLTSRRSCRTLAEEWTNLIKLKQKSLARKIAVHEEDKGRIAEIFEHINQAREQLVVRISVIVVILCFIPSPICLGGDRPQSPQDRTCNSGGPQGV
jgi:hypothetical protein